MDYNFSKFKNTHGRYESRITVTASRSIGFPTLFYNKNNIGSYKYVILYLDDKQKAIGIQFSNDEEEPHKFTLIKSKAGYGGNIVATSFFKRYGIDPKVYKGKYNWKKVKTQFGELFVIELRERETEG